ncbi:GPI-linked NAD(P)(+)--arginine ADP-ribosyltransferase 1 [Eudromia elegans]
MHHGMHHELLQEVPLDMAPDAFDDEYRGCAEAMEAELPALNRSEMARNEVYATAWRRARAELSTRRPAGPPALTAAQQTALMAYTMKGPLYGDFNAAVRGAGASRRRYLDAFPFKTLHFLLSRALQVLRAAQRRRCLRAYRGVSGLRFAARPRRPVRFGHFTSCSLSPGDARRFGRDTFFSLETCHGALIHNFSFFPGEEEVLVPPAEVFQVTNVSHSSGSVLIELRSQGLNSSYNCEFLQAPCRGDVRGALHRCSMAASFGRDKMQGAAVRVRHSALTRKTMMKTTHMKQRSITLATFFQSLVRF